MNLQDGINCINCYSKGKTELGRKLSNFAHTPFVLYGKEFASVEGWWYWRETHNKKVRMMYGYEAKKFGRTLKKKYDLPEVDENELREVYSAKIMAHPEIYGMLLQCKLPFDHYYEYGKLGKTNIVHTKWRWTGQLWNSIREEIIDNLHFDLYRVFN